MEDDEEVSVLLMQPFSDPNMTPENPAMPPLPEGDNTARNAQEGPQRLRTLAPVHLEQEFKQLLRREWQKLPSPK